ncbi:hypothetical protein GVN16_24405 [Emticicia sp. CRIBPO]|uniref:hypothetical protein n=1 Tax=Emticicia sp. CRIBPO TaxID=2683258 RepID=UPI001411FA7E|nr:hypothetical protein [Emticicia sp. CRIBPO]NBA88940.1 hypothetical protein [Emticicia sp. CRIBPO]
MKTLIDLFYLQIRKQINPLNKIKPINISELTPAIAIHPGEILLDELEARKIKQKEFALQSGMQKSQLNKLKTLVDKTEFESEFVK